MSQRRREDGGQSGCVVVAKVQIEGALPRFVLPLSFVPPRTQNLRTGVVRKDKSQ
jgi:hypothetical protein